MCKAFEDMKEEGRIAGEKQGRAREIVELGHEFGLSESTILGKLQSKLNLSKETAAEYLMIYAERTL